MNQQTSIFSYTDHGLVLVHNVHAVVNCDIEIIGKILAASMLFGGPPIQCFAPYVADFLVYGEIKGTPDIGWIPYLQIQRQLRKVHIAMHQ